MEKNPKKLLFVPIWHQELGAQYLKLVPSVLYPILRQLFHRRKILARKEKRKNQFREGNKNKCAQEMVVNSIQNKTRKDETVPQSIESNDQNNIILKE